MANGEASPVNLQEQESLQLLMELDRAADDLFLKHHEDIEFHDNCAGLRLSPNPSDPSFFYFISKHYFSDEAGCPDQIEETNMDIVLTKITRVDRQPDNVNSVMHCYVPKDGWLTLESYKAVNNRREAKPYTPARPLLNLETRTLIDTLKTAQPLLKTTEAFTKPPEAVAEETGRIKKFARKLGSFAFTKGRASAKDQ